MNSTTEHWQVIINGKNSGIREINYAFAKGYWETQALYKRQTIVLKPVAGPRK